MSKYKTIIGALVRKHIPIKYRRWNGAVDDPWRVPESEKDAIWENHIPKYFAFPPDCIMEKIKKKAKESMGISFKTFKGNLYKKFILEGKEPDWVGGYCPAQKDF